MLVTNKQRSSASKEAGGSRQGKQGTGERNLKSEEQSIWLFVPHMRLQRFTTVACLALGSPLRCPPSNTGTTQSLL